MLFYDLCIDTESYNIVMADNTNYMLSARDISLVW